MISQLQMLRCLFIRAGPYIGYAPNTILGDIQLKLLV